jgi:ribosomal protein L37E
LKKEVERHTNLIFLFIIIGPFCPYLEIHTTDACPIQSIRCQNPACSKRSCLICLRAIDDDADEYAHQSACPELQEYQQMVKQAIELGSLRRCPHCELTGIKDDNCTHMVCQRCGLNWCYFCGMKEEECDVDGYQTPTLTRHNYEWESNEKRCPMYLKDVHTVDHRWPECDDESLEYFHRCRTICELYKVLNEIGEDMFEELNDTFEIIDATGYTIDEIKDKQNRILIKYPGRDEDTYYDD